jgi:hypothetical protein
VNVRSGGHVALQEDKRPSLTKKATQSLLAVQVDFGGKVGEPLERL